MDSFFEIGGQASGPLVEGAKVSYDDTESTDKGPTAINVELM